jgi:NADH:ubiquinone oxidoreductase subunit E
LNGIGSNVVGAVFASASGERNVPVKVTVCAGSSCHVRGSRAVLKRFVEIIKAEKLGDEVALVGSFCMERCGESMSWKFNDEDISSESVEEAEQTLREKLAGAPR